MKTTMEFSPLFSKEKRQSPKHYFMGLVGWLVVGIDRPWTDWTHF
jgi:hypothetical protein